MLASRADPALLTGMGRAHVMMSTHCTPIHRRHTPPPSPRCCTRSQLAAGDARCLSHVCMPVLTME